MLEMEQNTSISMYRLYCTSPKVLTFSRSLEDDCTYIMHVADVSVSLILNKGPTTKFEHPFCTINT